MRSRARIKALFLYLHDIAGRDSPVEVRDSRLGAGGRTFDVIVTNPPFGKKQSYRIVRDDGEIETEREDYDRQDFFVRTSNKQLTFLQHIMTVLAEVQQAAPKAKVLSGERVRFEIAGGNYRLVAAFDFRRQIVLVKFIGTHADYDRIDALAVSQF